MWCNDVTLLGTAGQNGVSNPFTAKANSQNNENKKNDTKNQKQNNQKQKTATTSAVSEYPMLIVYERKEDRQGKKRFLYFLNCFFIWFV
jgi:hypothetical protein